MLPLMRRRETAMPLYTFHLFQPTGMPGSFEARTLADDGATFARAGELLQEHLTCDRVEVWDRDRPVIERHRFQPILRPVGA